MKKRALIMVSVCVALVLLTGVCGICFYEADYSGVLDGILAEVDGKTVIEAKEFLDREKAILPTRNQAITVSKQDDIAQCLAKVGRPQRMVDYTLFTVWFEFDLRDMGHMWVEVVILNVDYVEKDATIENVYFSEYTAQSFGDYMRAHVDKNYKASSEYTEEVLCKKINIAGEILCKSRLV